MDVTSNIDLLDDEEEEKKSPLDTQTVPPSLSNVFSSRQELDTAISNFVPDSYYKDARDRVSKTRELLKSSEDRMKPLLQEMGTFRDELNDTANDIPKENRVPFWADLEIEDADNYINEINNEFQNFEDTKDDNGFLIFGGQGAERSARALPLRGKWDGIVSKYSNAKADNEIIRQQHEEATAYRDEFTKRYLTMSDPQRRALQDLWEAQNPDVDETTKARARSRVSSTAGYDPYAGSTLDILGYASKAAQTRRSIHSQSNYQAELQREYDLAREAEKRGLRFTKNGYFAGYPMNVSEDEAKILSTHKNNPDKAIADFGEDAVDKARFSEVFNATVLDYRTAHNNVMMAESSGDAKKLEKAEAEFALAKITMREALIKGNDMQMLGELVGRMQSKQEYGLMSNLMAEIGKEAQTDSQASAFENGAKMGLLQTMQSWSALAQDIGLTSDKDHVAKQAEYAAQMRIAPTPLRLGDIQSAGTAMDFATEMVATMGTQYGASLPAGLAAGYGTKKMTQFGVNALEKLSKSSVLKRVPLLRGALQFSNELLKTKAGKRLLGAMPVFTGGAATSYVANYGGAYMEAAQAVKTETDPEGIDLMNQEAHLRLLHNPEAVAQVKRGARGKAGAISAIEGLTFFAGGLTSQAMLKMGAKGTVIPTIARGVVDGGMGSASEVAGLYAMHQTMGMEQPFLSFEKNAKGEYEFGGYLAENMEEVIMEAIGGPIVDVYQTGLSKAFTYTGKKYNEAQGAIKDTLADKNFNKQLESMAQEVLDAEAGEESSHRGSVIAEDAVTETEYGSTGTIDMGQGKKYTTHTAKDDESLIGLLTDRLGEGALGKRETKFLDSLFTALQEAGGAEVKENWRNMRIVFRNDYAETTPKGEAQPPMQYSQNANTLFINTDAKSNYGSVTNKQVDVETGKVRDERSSLLANIVHEVGHFSERYMVGDARVKEMFEKIDGNFKSKSDGKNQGMFMAFLEYNTEAKKRALAGSPDAWAKERDAFYAQYESDDNFARVAKSEWWAMQFSRVAQKRTEGMDKGIVGMIKNLYKALRKPYRDMMGNAKLSNAEVDAELSEMFGFRPETSPTNTVNESGETEAPDPQKLAENAADLASPTVEPVKEEQTDAEPDAFDQDQELAIPEPKKKKKAKDPVSTEPTTAEVPKSTEPPKKTKTPAKKTPKKAKRKPTPEEQLARQTKTKKTAALKRIVTAAKSTPEQVDAALREARDRVRNDPNSNAQKVLDAYNAKTEREKKRQEKLDQIKRNEEYATMAYQDPKKALGKNSKGSPLLEDNAYFNINKKGEVIGIQDPKTGTWVGIEPASKRGRKTKPSEQMQLDLLDARAARNEKITKVNKNLRAKQAELVKAMDVAFEKNNNKPNDETRALFGEYQKVTDRLKKVSPYAFGAKRVMKKTERIQRYRAKTGKVPILDGEGQDNTPDSKQLAKALGGSQQIQSGMETGHNYTTKSGVEVTFNDNANPMYFNADTKDEVQLGGDVELNFIGVPEQKNRRKGAAGKELDRILAKADERDMSIQLLIDPYSTGMAEGGMTARQLRKWYASKGFIFQGSNPNGYRPRVSEDPPKLVTTDDTLDARDTITSSDDSKAVRQVFSEKQSARIDTLAGKLLPFELRRKLAEAPIAKTEAEVLGKEVWDSYRQAAEAQIRDTTFKQKVLTEIVKRKQPNASPHQRARKVMEIVEDSDDTLNARGTVKGAFYSRRVPKIKEIMVKASSNPQPPVNRKIVKVDVENSQRIADLFDAGVNAPNDPKVREAYVAMARETEKQYEVMVEAGYKVEMYPDDGEPYKSSPEMLDDVIDNKHMWIFGTESGYGEEGITEAQRAVDPLLAKTKYKDVNGKTMLVNDLFRAVHDFFGHGERSNSFGALGEENAWDAHSQMFSPLARRAMTTETRGQNSWVNFGKHIRRKDGTMPKKGDPDYKPLADRPFAEQKSFLLPDDVVFQQWKDEQAEVDDGLGFIELEDDTLDARGTFQRYEDPKDKKPKAKKPKVKKLKLTLKDKYDIDKYEFEIKETKFDKNHIDRGWFMLDGRFMNIGENYHTDALVRLAKANLDHPHIQHMLEYKIENMDFDYGKPDDAALERQAIEQLSYDEAMLAGMIRVEIQGKRIFLEGRGTLPPNEVRVAVELAAIERNKEVYWESYGTRAPAKKLFPDDSWDVLGARPTNWVSKVSDEHDALRVGTAKLGSTRKPIPTTANDNLTKERVPRKVFEKQMQQLNDLKHLPASIRRLRNPDKKYEAVVEFFKDNLLALHDKFDQRDRSRATHWYDGARTLAENISKKFTSTKEEQAAGVIAALSPQNDWFQNVAQGEQLVAVWNNDKNTPITETLVRDTLESMVRRTTLSTSVTKGKTKEEKDALLALAKEGRREILESVLNTTIGKIQDPKQQAWAARLMAETRFGRNYQNLNPEGLSIGMAINDGGDLSNHAWGGAGDIAKALSALKDGSLENITEMLGNKHKVRSFFNNIIAPNSPFGDVTIDTHAVAAAHLLPMAASSLAVSQNFGTNMAGSPAQGINGGYHIYLEAYRRAARERDIQPRQMQSITWEAVRLLYPKEEKGSKLAQMQNVWNNNEDVTATRAELLSQEIGRPIWSLDGQSDVLGARAPSVLREKVGQKANVGTSPRDRQRQASRRGSRINGIELDPREDPTGFNRRIFDDTLGARGLYATTPDKFFANARATLSASQQVFLDDSLSIVERLKQTVEIFGDPLRRKVQDKMLPVRRLIDVLEEAKGGTFKDDLQTYVKHENYHGRTGAALTNHSEDFELPIAQSVVDNQINVEVLDDVMHLRHAQERNAVNREQNKVVTVSYRRAGRLVTKSFKGYGADAKARAFSTGFKVSWVNTFADGTTETKTKEFAEQAKAEAFAKKKLKRSQKPNWPRQGNVKLVKGRLTGRTISSKSTVEAGSGYTDDTAKFALALNKKAIEQLHKKGEINDDQLERITRMIDEVKKNPNGLKAYMDTANIVDKMNRASLERQYKSGLIAKKDFDRIRKAYKHFIPLRGWEEVSAYYEHSNMDVKNLLNQTMPAISRGMNTMKHKMRASSGLQEGTMVSNHLAYAFALARQGIVESEKNEVMRSFFDLVATAHKDPALKGMAKNWFSYTKGLMITTVGKDGRPRKQLDPRWKDDPNVIGMKINGQTVAMRLQGDRLDGTSSVARALKNLGAEKTGAFVRTVKFTTRWMAALRTTLSPAFTPVNFVRDWGMGFYSIKGLETDFKEQIERGEITEQEVNDIKSEALKNLYNPNILRKAFQGAVHHSTGGRGMDVTQGIQKLIGKKFTPSAETLKWSAIFKDFSDNGGRIQHFGFSSVQKTASSFGASVRELDPNDPQKIKSFIKGAYDFMDTSSGAIENLIRVTTYDALVRKGISKQKAANMALNLTTNFTRKGEWTTALNGMYLFFNAGVQGSYKVLSTAYRAPKARKFLGGAVLLGFMNSFINRILSDEDEELEASSWDRVSPYSKTHNLHFFLPSFGEKHAKIPTPYGINVFTSAGTLLENVVFGDMKVGDAAMTWGSTALESFSPIGGSSMASALTPTVLQPITDLGMNMDYKGAPIYKEDHFNKSTPDSSLHWSSTSELSKSIAQGLNKLTGGDLERAGGIDISPDTIDYMANHIFGGLGGFLTRSADFGAKVVSDEKEAPSLNDIPIVRRFLGDETAYYDTEKFYKLINMTTNSQARIDRYRKEASSPEELRAVLLYETPRAKLHKSYTRNIQPKIAKIRKDIEAIRSNKNMTGQQKHDQTELLKRRRKVIMNQHLKQAKRLGIDDY